TIKRKGKKVRVKVIRTRITFSSALTENGAAATGTITTTAAGKKVRGAKRSFILTAKSATLTATGVLHKDASVPTGQTASANALDYSSTRTAHRRTQTASRC